MPNAYLVVLYLDAPSEDAVAAYAGDAKAHMEAMGGTFIGRGVPKKVFEAGTEERSVIIAFENVDAAIAAFEHPHYQALVPRLGGVKRDVRVIEGV